MYKLNRRHKARCLSNQGYFFRTHYGNASALAMKWLVAVGTLIRLSTFFQIFSLVKKGLIKKIANYVVVQLQYRLAMPYVWGYPYVLIVDTTNICNLKCRLCATGLDMPGRAKGRMDFGLFKKIVDDVGDYALSILLHNWGEPLLNKDIYPMIEYAKGNRIKTVVSSNLNLLGEEDAEALISSGLDQLIVSLDGATEETYKQYRIGGNFHQVVKNIELLVQKREDMRSSTPRIIWQFLVFRHNAHEIPQARTMAARLKVDDINVYGGYLGGPGQTPYVGDKSTPELASRWLCSDNRFVGEFDYFSNPDYLSKKRCYFLWKMVTINWDGSISPCCCVFDPSTDFGNIKEQKFHEIWNNDLFQNSRAIFSKNRGLGGKVSTICSRCKLFKKA